MDRDLTRILLIVHTHYLNVHNKGQLLGYFIASSNFSPFVVALLLFQVPRPSCLAIAMLLVWYTYLLADPLMPPTFPLIVVITFFMRYIFRRCMGQAIAYIFLAMWAAGHIDIPFVGLPAAASSWPLSAAVSWWGPTWRR